MPRKNRVNPFGELIATDARGLFMGNRGGALHNNQGELTEKRWVNNRWIICLLEFKGRERKVMTPGRYTELFFTDESAALAAGHRPCAECRREDYKRFKAAWIEGNVHLGFENKTSIDEIDRILQAERVTQSREKIDYEDHLGNLPDGTFINYSDLPGTAFLVWGDSLWRWSPDGYTKEKMLAPETLVNVLTPKSTVNAFRSGYVPSGFFKVAFGKVE